MPDLTVLYDADCGVCRLTILALERMDRHGRLVHVPLQSFAGDRPTRDELLATLHVRDRAGRWVRGGDAALRIAAALPILRPLAIVGWLPGARWAAGAAYRLVARNRGALSRLLNLDSCAPRLRAAEPDAWSSPRVVKRETGSQ